MAAEPCRCSGPNPQCRRAGVPMIGAMHDLCSGGGGFTAAQSASHRAKWDGLPVREALPPVEPHGLYEAARRGLAGIDRLAGGRTPLPVLRPPCTFLGPLTQECHAGDAGLHQYECDHEPPHGDRGIVTRKGVCAKCPDYAPKAPAEKTREVPEGGAAVARSRPMRWAYGVTTCPARRANGLLVRTLQSLDGAGFGQPWLFVDGAADRADWGTVWPAAAGVTMRYPNVRTAGAWVLSLWELWIRQPEADRYAIFQDDIVLCKDVRQYLEKAGYPERSYLNLLTFPRNQALAPKGELGWFPTDQMGKSACGLVFDSAAVRALFSTGYLFDRFMSPDRGWRAIDGGVVEAMKKVGWRELCHNPSLTMHTGEVSSMGNRSHPATTSFPGEDFSALDLLGE